jgi:hypothetical protein
MCIAVLLLGFEVATAIIWARSGTNKSDAAEAAAVLQDLPVLCAPFGNASV